MLVVLALLAAGPLRLAVPEVRPGRARDSALAARLGKVLRAKTSELRPDAQMVTAPAGANASLAGKLRHSQGAFVLSLELTSGGASWKARVAARDEQALSTRASAALPGLLRHLPEPVPGAVVGRVSSDPRRATVELEVRPPNALLQVDGSPLQMAPAGRVTLELSPGRHRIEARLEGYVGKEEVIELSAAETRALRLMLEPER